MFAYLFIICFGFGYKAVSINFFDTIYLWIFCSHSHFVLLHFNLNSIYLFNLSMWIESRFCMCERVWDLYILVYLKKSIYIDFTTTKISLQPLSPQVIWLKMALKKSIFFCSFLKSSSKQFFVSIFF